MKGNLNGQTYSHSDYSAHVGRAKFRYQVFKMLLLLIISICMFFQFNIVFYVLKSPSSLVTVLHTSILNKNAQFDPNIPVVQEL